MKIQTILIVIATTHQNGTCSMLTSAKLSVGYLVVGVIRELNKELLLHCFSIYINTMWSVLQQYVYLMSYHSSTMLLPQGHHAIFMCPNIILFNLHYCQDCWRWTWLLFSLFTFYFILFLFLFFSIFRTTRVRAYRSRCHISHKLMAKSQDWSRNLEEWSRRFWNKVTSYNIDNTCWPHAIHMVL